MSKTLLINESQKKLILLESINDEFGDVIKKNYDFAKKIIKISSEQISINLEFLFTWGATIGGFIGPLNDFIVGRFPELSDVELSLILTGVIAVHYVDNKRTVNRIMEHIKEKGIFDVFSSALKKSEELKTTFLNFISSLNLTLHKVTNIMSYAFIIPLIPMIYESVSNGILTIDAGKEIALRLGSFGLITITGVTLREFIIKLINRFNK
jgi:hypothetical protein